VCSFICKCDFLDKTATEGTPPFDWQSTEASPF
jgi:hypothetical protein